MSGAPWCTPWKGTPPKKRPTCSPKRGPTWTPANSTRSARPCIPAKPSSAAPAWSRHGTGSNGKPCATCNPHARTRQGSLDPGGGPAAAPGGRLIFLVNSVLLMLAVPDEDGRPATERATAGECGLEAEDLIELRSETGAVTRYPFVTLEWARQWPCEEVWKTRKPAGVLPTRKTPRRRFLPTTAPGW